LAFDAVGLDWKEYVGTDVRYMRPSEVDLLLGDATKAREDLGWEPRVSFKELVEIMVEADWKIAREEVALAAHKTAVE
jgi:GDPmannose 4,6-dehydratase